MRKRRNLIAHLPETCANTRITMTSFSHKQCCFLYETLIIKKKLNNDIITIERICFRLITKRSHHSPLFENPNGVLSSRRRKVLTNANFFSFCTSASSTSQDNRARMCPGVYRTNTGRFTVNSSASKGCTSPKSAMQTTQPTLFVSSN